MSGFSVSLALEGLDWSRGWIVASFLRRRRRAWPLTPKRVVSRVGPISLVAQAVARLAGHQLDLDRLTQGRAAHAARATTTTAELTARYGEHLQAATL